MTATIDRSASVSANQTLKAPPHDIFPLLCPVREYDWIDDWECLMISSRTGIAELNCVFTTKRDDRDTNPVEEVWIITRYEPPKAIEFVKFCDGFYVIKYDIWLNARAGNQTQVVWTQTHIPLSPDGKTALEHVSLENFQDMVGHLEQKLNQFLADEKTSNAAIK